ncbi:MULTISPECIES: hypothetical protein [Burkholderiaceae]|uniref:hypothetical protein n=1 Tax=Burkholderiaceae TaxID=119060 RepID=UPI001114255B|nr:hypothetical protein [Ralstonia sp. 25mfcol4.1]
MKRKLLIFVTIGLFGVTARADCVIDSTPPTLPQFMQQENYSSVREKLLSAGWTPYRAPEALPCAAEDERCKDRPEMLACSGVQLAPCAWLWQKNKVFIVVGTIYEVEDERFTGVGVYHECPPSE